MKYSSPYKIMVITMISLLVFTGVGYSAPTGGNVSHGDANINQSGGNTIINQNSDKAIINWGSFDIDKGQSVIFNQKDSNSIVLNRVNGSGASIINGSLSANGKVFILNSNGILIGGSASINTGSFLASTGKMSDKDFMNGNYNINGAFGDITNNGSIVVDNYGYAALLGRKVVNNGVISANLGRVELASGEAFRVSFYDNNLIGVSIEKGIAESYVSNTGDITAEGGTIYMSAKGLSDIIKSTVNNEGVIYAGSITNDGGRVVLSSEFGEVTNNSLIDVSSDIGQAGNVEIYGNDITIESKDAVIDASGESGGKVYIKASKSTEVKDKATITASGNGGNGGEVSILSKGVLFFDKGASLFSQSVTGNGGFIEVSSVDSLHLKGTANTASESGEHGSFLLDVYNLVISNTPSTGRELITTITINDINTALSGPSGEITLSAVNIGLDPSVYGLPIGLGVGDLSFIASDSITLVSPNIDVDKLTMTAENNINMSLSNDPTQIGNITANEFNLTATRGNIDSDGVMFDVNTLTISSLMGSTKLLNIAPLGVTPVMPTISISGEVGQNLEITAVDPIAIVVGGLLSAGESISFDLQGVASSLVGGASEITTQTLTLTIPNGRADLKNTFFTNLTADIDDLIIMNNSTEKVVVDSLKVYESFDYTQTNVSDVIFNEVDLGSATLLRLNIELNKGKLIFPFEAAEIYFPVFNIKNASTIVFKSDGAIDLTGVGGGLTGTSFFNKFGQNNNAGDAKLLSFEAVGKVVVDIISNRPNTSLNMVSETGTATANCTVGACSMTAVSATAAGDITFNNFGTTSYSAESKDGGDILINMAAQALPPTSPSVVIFGKLITSGVGTITLNGTGLSLAAGASINILELNAGSGGLILNLPKNPLVNIISQTEGILNIDFGTINNKFGSFSVISEGSINFNNAFDFAPTKTINLTSKLGDITLINDDIDVTSSITLSGKSVRGVSGILNLKTSSTTIDGGITLDMHGDTPIIFDIDLANTGVLNLAGNVHVNIHSPTATIGSLNNSATSMTGKISIDGTGVNPSLTLRDTANLESFTAVGVGDVILEPTFKATTTGEFSINASGKIMSFKDAATGDKASIHADSISLVADTIGGYTSVGVQLPSPGNYLNSAIMVEANTGYFEATNTAPNLSIIDIGSADFMSSLFKYKFAPAPAVDTFAFLNGLNIKSSWHNDLNASRNNYYLYNPDLRHGRYLKYDIYDEILALGDALIISEILYPKYIHAKFKVGNSIFLK